MAVLIYPFDLPETDSFASLAASLTYVQFSSYERMTTKASSPVNDIFLYLPEKLTMPSTVKWDMTGIGMGSAQAENAVRGGMDPTVKNIGGMVGGIVTAGATQAGLKAITDGVATLSGSMANSEHLYGLAAGGIPNPYMTMLFKGVDPRNFEFSFKFFPHNEMEAIIIDQIVETFRADSLPPGSQSANPTHLGYPREFEIQYMIGGMPHPWLNKFKRSVITRLDLDYTGASMWSVSTQFQFPTYLVMNISFTELEIVLRDDVYAGF